MGIVHTNYSVVNEYLLNEKFYFHKALDVVTLPLRVLAGGRVVDLKEHHISVESNYLNLSSILESSLLASLISRVLRVVLALFCAYFYRVSLLASGALVLKYFLECKVIQQRLLEIQQNAMLLKETNEEQTITLDTTGLEKPAGLHPYKAAIYDKMKGERNWFEDSNIRLTIYPFQRDEIKGSTIFPKQLAVLNYKEGYFSYPVGQKHQEEWTANFSSAELFSRCMTEDLTQDELQVMEHPGLYHIKCKIEDKPEMKELRGDQIALITGAKRYGMFIAKRCYGTDFAKKDLEYVVSLALSIPETESHIFCMSAPKIPASQSGKPYCKEDLESLFYRSFHAFSKIKQRAVPQKVRIHIGNWGCGTSGHRPRVVALMQIAAAHLAGIDFVDYYPLGEKEEWRTAIYYYQALYATYPTWTVDDFLSEMAQRAKANGFLYWSNRN